MANKFITLNDAPAASAPAVLAAAKVRVSKDLLSELDLFLKDETRLITAGEKWTRERATEEIRARQKKAEENPSEENIAAITSEGASAIMAKYADNLNAVGNLRAAVSLRAVPVMKRILAIVGPAIEGEMARIAASHEAECKAHGITYNRDSDPHVRSLDRLLQNVTARLGNERCPPAPSEVIGMLGELKASGGIFK